MDFHSEIAKIRKWNEHTQVKLQNYTNLKVVGNGKDAKEGGDSFVKNSEFKRVESSDEEDFDFNRNKLSNIIQQKIKMSVKRNNDKEISGFKENNL